MPMLPPETEGAPAEVAPRGQWGHLGGALAVLLASLFFLSWFYRLPISEADEGLIAVGAERILHGQVPFRDFFSELGPGSLYLQAGIFKALGISTAAMRMTAWLLGGIISGLIYLLARRVLPAAAAYAPSAVFTLVCYTAAYRVSHHWWGNFFLLLAVLCLLPTGPGRVIGTKRLCAAGGLAGITLLCMQSMGFWILFMGTAFLALQGLVQSQTRRPDALRRGIRQAGWFVAGALAVVGAAAGYLATRGAFTDWVQDNFIFLLVNYRAYLDVPQASPWTIIPHIGWLALTQPSVHFSLYLLGYTAFFIGPVVAFAGTGWQVFAARRRANPNAPALLLYLLAGLGAFLANTHALDTFHLMSASPLMLVLLALNGQWVFDHRPAWRRAAQAGAALALGLAAFTGIRKAVNTAPLSVAVPTRRGIVYRAEPAARELRARIDAIQKRVPAGANTFIFPYNAELYFLTATRNPTRYDVLLPEFHTSQQIAEALAALRESKPEFIFSLAEGQRWTIRPHFPDDPPDVLKPHLVASALRAPGSGYRVVQTLADMEVWAREP